jgi:hypothetical protein
MSTIIVFAGKDRPMLCAHGAILRPLVLMVCFSILLIVSEP